MIDLQNEKDSRGIKLSCAGIRQFSHPIILGIDKKNQQTIATFSCSTSLQEEQRGAHMSRFIALLSPNDDGSLKTFSLENIADWHDRLLDSQEAHQGEISLKATFFLPKTAPVSKKSSLMDYELTLLAQGSKEKKTLSLFLKVHATSCCPCSKAISDFGAHNQRSLITLKATLIEESPTLSLHSLIGIMEQSASCDLYPLIKREDEKYVTERSYQNAKFAEDIARDLATNLSSYEGKIAQVSIDVENFESIHNHSAFASCVLY